MLKHFKATRKYSSEPCQTLILTESVSMGVGSKGQEEPCPSWIFIHCTVKAERSLTVLYFSLDFSVASPPNPGNFSADTVECKLVLQFSLKLQ